MQRIYFVVIACLFMAGCSSTAPATTYSLQGDEFVMAFGSCNKQEMDNVLWDDILALNPSVWVWGGDNVYADTDDKREKRRAYEEQRYQDGYRELKKQVHVTGTWDDHDYGKGDGGGDYAYKEDAQELFLDFMDVPKNHPRRSREGIYHAEEFMTRLGKVRLIMLDTRYFRSPLTRNFGSGDKRYLPNKSPGSTVLGEAQWKWLETQLYNSNADFNIIVSSIQVLSDKHGFETWGNFPLEVEKLLNMIKDSKARGVMVLSGDRHISEFSRINVEGMAYPLIDFTSSGMTHTYEQFTTEENAFRVGGVVKEKSFGLLRLNLADKTARLLMVGDGGKVLQELKQGY
ncbi:alkaline phosphatase D family protein [Robertkochia sediminum]|uniref:alkaline phosphatase D family protein n=1 Tax=Robertkochia sediminum TaxID=2785326 RepID=UPI00193490CB|nr:alkaline phosphatase D family protein [Robertkochia sediminum]MBL7472153.1 alkaline phosphatase family protein [Robertkochia sediminum]